MSDHLIYLVVFAVVSFVTALIYTGLVYMLTSPVEDVGEGPIDFEEAESFALTMYNLGYRNVSRGMIAKDDDAQFCKPVLYYCLCNLEHRKKLEEMRHEKELKVEYS